MFSSFTSLLVRSISALLALAPLSAAGVLTVGPAGSGAQFTQIHLAVNAARVDDVLLVFPGTYQGILVQKPLRILGTGPGVVIDGGADNVAVSVRGIAAGQELVLSGVSVRSGSFRVSLPTLRLESCLGTIILHDVSVLEDAFAFDRTVALEVQGCARVLLLESRILDAGFEGTAAVVARGSELWLSGSEIRAVDGSVFATRGTHGIDVTDSTLRVWRSQIAGGRPNGKAITTGVGGTAIRSTRSTVQLFGGPGALVLGGDGEDIFSIFGSSEGPGGPGLDLLQNSTARVQQSLSILGGENSSGLTRAPAIRADATSSFTLETRILPTLASSVRQTQLGSSFSLELAGNPGSFQIPYLSLRLGQTRTYPHVEGFGLLVLDRTQLFPLAGNVLPSSGTLTLGLRVPTTPVLRGATLFFQAAERSASGFAISNPALVTITH